MTHKETKQALKKSQRTLRLVQLGILAALMVVLDISGLGFIKIGIVEMTIMMVPVIIGAISLGKTAGAILGGVFGLLSFLQCFGRSIFGAQLLAINPILCFILCLVPRILAGFLVALVFQITKNKDKTRFLSYGVAGLVGSLTNTILFVVGLVLMFGGSDYIQGLQGGQNVFLFMVTFVGINGLIEAGVCTVVGAVVAKAVDKFVKWLYK